MDLKEKARELRNQNGLSIKEICETINKPYTTVTRWVKGIELTENQEKALFQRSPNYKKSKVAGNLYSEKHAKVREKHRENGKAKIVSGFDNVSDNELLLIGLSLYWAEGSKTSRNELAFSNSDPRMIQCFILFLEKTLNVSRDKIRIEIQCYTDVSSKDEIVKFWLNTTGLDEKSISHIRVNDKPISSKQTRIGKSQYGTCKLIVFDTEKAQNILGMIEKLAGTNNPAWGIK